MPRSLRCQREPAHASPATLATKGETIRGHTTDARRVSWCPAPYCDRTGRGCLADELLDVHRPFHVLSRSSGWGATAGGRGTLDRHGGRRAPACLVRRRPWTRPGTAVVTRQRWQHRFAARGADGARAAGARRARLRLPWLRQEQWVAA